MLHHQREMTVAVDEVMDYDDVGMIEGCDRASLGQKTLTHITIDSERWRQLLDGDLAIKCLVPSEIHDAHGATAKLFGDLVIRQRGLQRNRSHVKTPRGVSPGRARAPAVNSALLLDLDRKLWAVVCAELSFLFEFVGNFALDEQDGVALVVDVE